VRRQGFLLLNVPCWFLVDGRDLDAVEVEDVVADTVMATVVWFVAVEAEVETATFRLLLRGQPLQRRPILSWLCRGRWWCRKSEQRLLRRRCW